MTASTSVISRGMEGDNFTLSSITNLLNGSSNESYFEEESNFHMLGDLSIFILNSSIFMIQSIQLSKYASEIMCGRTSKTPYFVIPITFIGSTVSYGLLFFCFSCLSSTMYYWNRVSIFFGILVIL
jgi:hypothetical protein